MRTDYHEGDMAEELAQHEFQSVPPLELLNLATQGGMTGSMRFDKVLDIAERVIRDRWLELAQREPDKVRELYAMTIGLDGFPGGDEDAL